MIAAWMISVLSASLTAVPPASHTAGPTSEYWVYVEEWRRAPADVAPEERWSPAAVLRFCPGGRFVLTMGVFRARYRGKRLQAEFGPSDGLQIWQGTWSATSDEVTVDYRLVDYEIAYTGVEKDLSDPRYFTFPSNTSQIALQVPHASQATRFHPLSASKLALRDRFIECKDHSHPK